MIDIIKHWIPELKQRKTKFAYTSVYCPFCGGSDCSGKVFRVNIKLKVFKCYNCGKSGKDINKFVKYIKQTKKLGYSPFRNHTCVSLLVGYNEDYYGCETYSDSLLPF